MCRAIGTGVTPLPAVWQAHQSAHWPPVCKRRDKAVPADLRVAGRDPFAVRLWHYCLCDRGWFSDRLLRNRIGGGLTRAGGLLASGSGSGKLGRGPPRYTG